MYSDNDYRYYLEHQLMESGDFLAHYGVKGMKWKDHQYVIDPRLRERMAKGLGINRPRTNNSLFGNRNSVSSRFNSARRRAQLGVGRQLIKSKTGRKILRKAATGKVKREIGGAKRSVQRKLLKKTLKSDTGRKLLKSAARRKVKREVNKVDRKIRRGVMKGTIKGVTKLANNKLVRTAVKNQAKRQLDTVSTNAKKKAGGAINSGKKRANDVYKNVRSNSKRVASDVKRGASAAKRTAKKAQNYAKKTAKYKAGDYLHDARENADAIRENLKNRSLDPTGKNTRHNIKQMGRNLRDAGVSGVYNSGKRVKKAAGSAKRKASKAVKKYGSGVKREARDAYRSTSSDVKRIANSARKRARKKVNSASNRVHSRRAVRRLNNRNW